MKPKNLASPASASRRHSTATVSEAANAEATPKGALEWALTGLGMGGEGEAKW